MESVVQRNDQEESESSKSTKRQGIGSDALWGLNQFGRQGRVASKSIKPDAPVLNGRGRVMMSTRDRTMLTDTNIDWRKGVEATMGSNDAYGHQH